MVIEKIHIACLDEDVLNKIVQLVIVCLDVVMFQERAYIFVV